MIYDTLLFRFPQNLLAYICFLDHRMSGELKTATQRKLQHLRYRFPKLSHRLCFGTCFYFLSTAVGEIIAVDKRFLDLSTNVMMHVEAIIVTTLITTARVYKRTEQPLPAECYEPCSKCITPRSHCL